jgi:ABC-type multidrug transport system ATPase subunit
MRSLSGGERTRANIALAIARDPKVLLIDEPFRDIDPLTVEVISKALRRLAERGCAMVMTGHEAESLFACVDRVSWLVAGRTHDLGPPAAAVTHERFATEYLAERRG